MHLHLEHTDLICRILLACAHELDLVSGLYGAVHHFEICYDSTERVEDRVKDEGLKRCIRISCRSRYTFYYRIKDLRDSLSCLS